MAEQAADVELLALFDAETGDFIDLVRSSPTGLHFRERGSWEFLQPADSRLDGAELIEVDESFLSVVDNAQAAATAPTRKQALEHEPFEGKAL